MIDLVAKEKPNLVVISSFADSPFSTASGKEVTVADRPDLYAAGMRDTLNKLLGSAGNVVVLEDTPHSTMNVLSCLATASSASACAFPNDANSADREQVRKVTGSFPGVTLVDPYSQVCPRMTCKVVTNHQIMYSDGGHLTNSFAMRLVPWLSSWLRPAVDKGSS